MIVPPGIPKMYSTPSASRARRTAIAPVIFALAISLPALSGSCSLCRFAGFGFGVRRVARAAQPSGLRRARPPLYLRLERGDRALLRQQEAELVHAIHEAVPAEALDREPG